MMSHCSKGIIGNAVEFCVERERLDRERRVWTQ
jgi:hypothetical protein